eukprot:2149670-Ditylum_brightwellii.AAC.1
MTGKEKQHYIKSLLLKGLVPAASIARYCDFSAKLEKKAARYKSMSPSRASSDKLPADCVVYNAQQAENSSRMTPPYICMGQT